MRREEDESTQGEVSAGEVGASVGDEPAAETPSAGPSAQPWLWAACACLLAAAAALILGFYDAAFVAAALGAVAWFLNVRSKLPRPPEEEEDDGEQN